MKLNSIALRLTLWYSVLSTILIAAAGGGLYWVLSDRLNREGDTFLAGKIAEARSVLSLHTHDFAALHEELLHEGESFPDIRVRVINAQGATVADSSDVDGKGVPSIEFDAMVWPDATSGANWRSGRHGRYRLMQQRVGDLTIHAAMRLDKEARLLHLYRNALCIAVIGVLALAALAGYAIARHALSPVHRLASMVDALGATQLHRRVGDDALWPAELRQLAGNFDRLLARLDDAFARISRFSADIAHELRTPLHILRSEAEMTLARDRPTSEYRDTLISAVEEYGRMSRMVDALLFLARAEQPGVALKIQRHDVRAELVSVRDFFQAIADEQNIALEVAANGSVLADSVLLRRALCNLVDNALRHTPPGGEIMLKGEPDREGAMVLSIIDNGCGVAAAQLARLTERFYTVDRARQRRGQGTGLGLAIVQSIARLHGARLHLDSEIDCGMRASLHFPAAGAPQGDH